MTEPKEKCSHDDGEYWADLMGLQLTKQLSVKCPFCEQPAVRLGVHSVCSAHQTYNPECGACQVKVGGAILPKAAVRLGSIKECRPGDEQCERYKAEIKAKEDELKEYKSNNNAALWNDTLGKRMDQINALEAEIKTRDEEWAYQVAEGVRQVEASDKLYREQCQIIKTRDERIARLEGLLNENR